MQQLEVIFYLLKSSGYYSSDKKLEVIIHLLILDVIIYLLILEVIVHMLILVVTINLLILETTFIC